MTPDQAAAFINSQVLCATAEIASMHEANYTRELQGYTHAYDEEAFASIPSRYGLHYEDVMAIINDSNQA